MESLNSSPSIAELKTKTPIAGELQDWAAIPGLEVAFSITNSFNVCAFIEKIEMPKQRNAKILFFIFILFIITLLSFLK